MEKEIFGLGFELAYMAGGCWCYALETDNSAFFIADNDSDTPKSWDDCHISFMDENGENERFAQVYGIEEIINFIGVK